MNDRPLISVIFSFRNEEAVLEELITRVEVVLDSINVRYELIFVNDASTDKSLEILNDRRRFRVFLSTRPTTE